VDLPAGPVALILTRQKLPFIDRSKFGAAEGLMQGAYVLADPAGNAKPRVVLMASGSEVQLVIAAQTQLAARGVAARVVSMPSMEVFERQPAAYQDAVLPPGIPRVAIEAAQPMSWYRWVGLSGQAIGLHRFGASSPYERIYKELGITADAVVDAALRVTSA
jgi:transketolase